MINRTAAISKPKGGIYQSGLILARTRTSITSDSTINKLSYCASPRISGESIVIRFVIQMENRIAI